MAIDLNSEIIDKLSTVVEEATRSSSEGVKYFVEPAGRSLNRCQSKRHHIIFGRRGSGKSSLLRKAASELTIERRPIAWVDLEPFKGHSYPDLLISVLIATLKSFQNWLETTATAPATKVAFWTRFWGRIPTKSAYNKNKCDALRTDLSEIIKKLEEQLHQADGALLRIKDHAQNKSDTSSTGNAGFAVDGLSAGLEVNDSTSLSMAKEQEQEFRRSKIEYLQRHIMDYHKIFDRLAELSNGDSFLFLDDLYHIRKLDQARVVDYLHSIGKGHSLWLKIGTIRHRTEWYIHGNPPVGVKLGDDAEEIDLDLTLEKYMITKEFLKKILTNLTKDYKIEAAELFTSGALDRLVLASGGVARDFLAIFRRSIDVAREGQSATISVENINIAAGEYDSSKREEFKKDVTQEDENPLNSAFQGVRDFCLDQANCNCFLVDKDAKNQQVQSIHELVDLKLLHLVRSRVTVKSRKGKIYEAYMLDVSQYAGSRKRRGLDVIEFWKTGADDRFRRAGLIFV